jgi:hypothetical protein
MRLAACIAGSVLSLASAIAAAQQDVGAAGRRASSPERPDWEFAATGYWNDLRAGDSYASAIFAADRGALHLEARINYEAVHAQSAFIGWTFSTGEAVKLEFTPIVGYVGGDARGAIAGFEATVSAGRFDFYVEAEHVSDRTEGSGSYNYAWSELGFRPAEWLRLGVVAQRTRAYGGERDLQRGGFAQFTAGKLTAGVYWFNPGSADQVVIASIGASF